MSEFEISKAAKKQMLEVARVFKASRESALSFLPELHSLEEDVAYFTNSVFAENDVYVAREIRSGELLGFIAFTERWVNHLYLLPRARRNGIGTKLLELAQRRADTLDLWTFQRNLSALQ